MDGSQSDFASTAFEPKLTERTVPQEFGPP